MMEETKYEQFNLKDTVADMCSDDYRERFRAEYVQLAIRHSRLKKIIDDYMGDKDITLSCPVHILIKQLDNMRNYMTILEVRAVIEGIDLPRVF
jgi:hypothetical protein